MEPYELSRFSESLLPLQDYLAELAYRDLHRGLDGPSSLATIGGVDLVLKVIDDLPESLASLQRIARVLDSQLQSSVESFLQRSDLQRKLSRVAVKLRISQRARQDLGPGTVARAIRVTMGLFWSAGQRRRFSNDEGIDLEELLSDVTQLRNYSKAVSDAYSSRHLFDDEFEQSGNIDAESVAALLDDALQQVAESGAITPALRRKLVSQLNEAKVELAATRPNWKKIIGTLVVLSAITSGLADLPGALSTVRKALDYIVKATVSVPMWPRTDLSNIPAVFTLPSTRIELVSSEQEQADSHTNGE
jgi:hypothetical protein